MDFVKVGNDVMYNISRKSWVGGKIGIFAVNNNGRNTGSYAEFEYVNVE